MNPEHFTTAAIDYLQRTGAAPPAIQRRTPVTAAEPARRRMLQITGVGQFDKQALPRPGEAFRLISEDLLVGLYNYKIPVAFEIAADSAGRRIGIGTWLPDAAGSNDNTLEVNAEVLNAVLSGLYPPSMCNRTRRARNED